MTARRGSGLALIRVFLDDTRRCPEGWHPVRTAGEAIELLGRRETLDLSLDYDLRADPADLRPGIAVCEWLVEHGRWPTRSLMVHSANRRGAAVMTEMILASGHYPHHHPALRVFSRYSMGELHDQGWRRPQLLWSRR